MARKTITNIAEALACVRKLKSGKPCTMQELKSSLMLLDTAYRTAKSTSRQLRDQNAFLERLLNR